MAMYYRNIASSAIDRAGYDPVDNTLEIEFEDGRTYAYFDVPGEVFEALLTSASPGRFFNAQIRNFYQFEEY